MFTDQFRALVPRYLDDVWRDDDGLTEQQLSEGLAGHRFQIPQVLRDFYLAVGGCDDLMEAHHFFWDPDELELQDGYLLFLEDEDEQFTWGMPESSLDVPDPLVWRRNNKTGRWSSEEGTFSEFVLDMFAWVFEEEG